MNNYLAEDGLHIDAYVRLSCGSVKVIGQNIQHFLPTQISFLAEI